MKNYIYLLLILAAPLHLKAQPGDCIFKDPILTIHFGTGNVRELNNSINSYDRVSGYCPRDGYYAYVPYTSDCFRGDWLTLEEDHTPGDVDGNMMLVNAAPRSGTFLTTQVNGLKSGATYEFGVWMMNVCRISDKCPFPLLPRITIQVLASGGQVIMQMNTGELTRYHAPQWTQYKTLFTVPAYEGTLSLTMLDEVPGGCGNDFVLDDISFRECIRVKPEVKAKPKNPVKTAAKPPITAIAKPAMPAVTKPPVPAVTKVTVPPTPKTTVPPVNKPAAPVTSVPKKTVKKEPPVKNPPLQPPVVSTPVADSPLHPTVVRRAPPVLPAPPPVLTTRTNQLIRQVEAEAGEIRVDLYDNGTVDGDTVTVYDNNVLLVAHARLSEKPITFRIAIDAAHPRHELVMVADNLGSIPPNTSLMVVTAGTKRYEIYISSTEQKNAKVIFELQKE